MNTETCCTVIHEDVVKAAKAKMPPENLLYDLSELFKVFGDSTRIRILCALFESEMCVCDISAVLEMNQSAVSHQLRLLRSSGLVKTRRSGKSIYYSLDDDHVRSIFDQGLTHISEERCGNFE